MSFALDHDYCAVMPAEKDPKTDAPAEEKCGQPSNDGHKRKQQLSVREDVWGESTNIDERSSSLSPAHSIDSGVDASMEEFLADFPSCWNDELEDFSLNVEHMRDLEALLAENFPAELTGSREASKGDSGTRSLLNPNTKANVQFASGKGMSLSNEDEQAIIDRNKRNAIAARENRQKKKKYVEGLENDVAKLKEENKTLKTRNESMSAMIMKLSDEVKYLRSVLANESTISLLLKSVAATPGISLTSSLVQSSGSTEKEAEKESSMKQGERQYVTRSRKRRSDNHQSDGITESMPSKRTRGTTPGGVCLHVNHGKVSLELCANCEKKAMLSGAL